jgi:hypothetical protein
VGENKRKAATMVIYTLCMEPLEREKQMSVPTPGSAAKPSFPHDQRQSS